MSLATISEDEDEYNGLYCGSAADDAHEPIKWVQAVRVQSASIPAKRPLATFTFGAGMVESRSNLLARRRWRSCLGTVIPSSLSSPLSPGGLTRTLLLLPRRLRRPRGVLAAVAAPAIAAAEAAAQRAVADAIAAAEAAAQRAEGAAGAALAAEEAAAAGRLAAAAAAIAAAETAAAAATEGADLLVVAPVTTMWPQVLRRLRAHRRRRECSIRRKVHRAP